MLEKQPDFVDSVMRFTHSFFIVLMLDSWKCKKNECEFLQWKYMIYVLFMMLTLISPSTFLFESKSETVEESPAATGVKSTAKAFSESGNVRRTTWCNCNHGNP
jgi:hypothetical protein